MTEVFENLSLRPSLAEYFQDGLVERVFLERDRNNLFLHLRLPQVVHPVFIRELEEAIFCCLGEPQGIRLEIRERFDLPSALSAEGLYALYKESLVHLLKQANPICGAMVKELEPMVTDRSIVYPIDKNSFEYMSQNGMEELIRQVFSDRFGWEFEVRFEKMDDENRIYADFIRNRDKEQQKILGELVQAAVPREVRKVIQGEGTAKEPSDLLVGKKGIAGEVSKIGHFDEGTNEVLLEVQMFEMREPRELKGGKVLLVFDATDFTGSITCKCFVEKDRYLDKVKDSMKKGRFLRIKGVYKFDEYEKGMRVFVNAMEAMEDFRTHHRKDNSAKKRIELHLHTQMSDMDGVVAAKEVVKRAAFFGHPAVAITDHGGVQAFPDAFHAAHDHPVKILYGVEGYLVDDRKPVVRRPRGQGLRGDFVVFDLETTGLRAKKDAITEIGAVRIREGKIVDRFSSFVNPLRTLSPKIQELTGITPQMLRHAPLIGQVLPEFLEFCGKSDNTVLVAQNADFDMSFLSHQLQLLGLEFTPTVLDTLELARILFPDLKNYRLDTLAKHLDVRLAGHHRAVNDAEATAEIMAKLIPLLEERGIPTVDDLEEKARTMERPVKKYRPNHVVLLAKNRQGLLNLYKIISYSHIQHFFKTPRIPKSMLEAHRDGLLVGSACENSEIYRAVLEGKHGDEMERLLDFYDYLEIQPLGNNQFMVEKELVESRKELEEINKEIIRLGKSKGKLTVATGDVHFLNPEDEVYRRVLMAGKGFDDADNQAPLYYRTTEEMLEEFRYLGEEEAWEVVVENPHRINDSIENLSPVEKDKYPPVIEGAEEELAALCRERAADLYGNPLPELVRERLDRELNSIISNGFAVMYIIAQKLVKKSNDDGYLVGSRGSVGSSFAATMAGITEVNPLSPHYICPGCKYSDFDSEEVRAYAQNSGVDMPDKACPVCGTPLTKEGHDIPFETFLGFKGNKEPDIDLNFSGEYQSTAHEYTETLFGKGHVFRAGTIGTLADKTAYGFVKNYFEEREVPVNEAEITRIIQGCIGVRRTTGQHPGGIIVVPKDQEIYKFTPIQKPANDMNTNVVTTHFDYHSIDHNLLKLDILGHDDPTMIRMLEDLTGVEATRIPLDEPKVMSLFRSTQALGVTPEELDGCPLGALGVPEFGTDFVMQMLLETRPQTFSDLVRISGLSHGTDVWTNNAQELVRQGKADIKTVISTRDDIMTYLINKGLDKELSFTIMESVRKGKGLKPEWEEEMASFGVPDWYIWSCNTIKYMFPKAHAVAYVMMAYRIAYFKVHHPLAYYAAFFSIRAANFDFELMCKGKQVLEQHLRSYKQRFNELSKKEKDMIKDFKIVQEMYARGYEFEPIDLYTVDAHHFRICNNRIMPALSAIGGMGEKAAESIVEARKAGEFISLEDFRNRTKISKTLVDLLRENHILTGLPETNQISMF
nr:PolC-type DNA polymerase III [Anaerotalea alkaliphila]